MAGRSTTWMVIGVIGVAGVVAGALVTSPTEAVQDPGEAIVVPSGPQQGHTDDRRNGQTGGGQTSPDPQGTGEGNGTTQGHGGQKPDSQPTQQTEPADPPAQHRGGNGTDESDESDDSGDDDDPVTVPMASPEDADDLDDSDDSDEADEADEAGESDESGNSDEG